jgi:predicted DNA-binding transcriptional regulator AlpA
MQHAEKSALNKMLVTRKELKRMSINVSNSTLLRWEEKGNFPKRVRMSKTTVAWLLAEVEGWVDEKAETRLS